MALDAQGRPIPVWVPPPGPPPPATPPDHVSPHPDIENDVALLKGVVADLIIRAAAIEELVAALTQQIAKFAPVEEAFAEMPKLLARINMLEVYVAKGEKQYAITLSRLDSVEKQIFAAWEEGRVNPVPPA